MVRPSAALLARALRVLRACRFNSSHGWQLVGQPHALFEQRVTPKHLDGAKVTKDVANDPHSCFRRHNWTFTNADTDQGFLWYILRSSPLTRWEAPSVMLSPRKNPGIGERGCVHNRHLLGERGCIHDRHSPNHDPTVHK